jgi:hypothetical protein
MLSVAFEPIMLSVVMPNVILPNVVAPLLQLKTFFLEKLGQ